MNKRQIKKQQKKIRGRLQFLSRHYIVESGRRNGKTLLYRRMIHAVMSKRYKPFNDLKRYFEKLYISIDYSNGIDYGVITHAHIKRGIVAIKRIEIIKNEGETI